MLHRKEYRLYRVLWTIVPFGLSIIAFTLPALQKEASVQIDIMPIHWGNLFDNFELLIVIFRLKILK